MERNAAVVFDACVLYPASLRDLLMEMSRRAFLLRLFRAKWTDQIHEEWINSLLSDRANLARDKLQRTRKLMDATIPDCLVTGYEHRITNLHLPDKDDKHVLAAAIECQASIIVTANLDDFPAKYLGHYSIVARHPDNFICEDVLQKFQDEGEGLLVTAAQAIVERLTNPRVSRSTYFATLEKVDLKQTTQRLRKLIARS